MKKIVVLLLFSIVYTFTYAQDENTTTNLGANKDVRENIQKLLDSSNLHYSKGNFIKSLKFNVSILNNALDIEDAYYTHQGYRLLGYDYLILNDTALAKESFKNSEKYAKLSKNDTAIAQTKMDLANMYSTLDTNWTKAFFYHDESIRLFKKIKDSSNLAKAHYNTVLTAIYAQEYDKAMYHLEECETYNNYFEDSFGLGLNNLWANVSIERKDYELADKYLLQNIEEAIAKEFPIELEDAYLDYSTSLFHQGRFEEAFEIRQKYEEVLISNMESLQNSESEAVSAEYQVKEYKKSVLEAELTNELQAEIVENKSILNRVLIAISIVGLLLFLATLFAFRKRRELIQQLKIKNKEYLAAKEHSEKLAKIKSNFFSTVSHELRTPLYGVIGLSTILLEDKSLKSHEKDLKSLKFSADYLLALINDVLQLNKIDSQDIKKEEIVFNLSELIGSIASSFEYMRLQNKNEIHISISNEIPHSLKGNAVRLSQVMMNLVGNACKFTENGAIYINAYAHAKNETSTAILFEVKDTGIGIAKEKHTSIFEEFSQVESNNYSYQGTGLGLPIVKKLLALLDSEIQLESTLGEGSTFSFVLSFENSQEVKTVSEPKLLDRNLLVHKKILVAEDNRINQIVTQKILEKNGIHCTVVDDGAQAITEIKRAHYDLILMDLNMPNTNGFDATIAIRKFKPHIPIIALTAVEIEEVRREIFEAGMNDIIVKPYDAKKFIQTILKNILHPIEYSTSNTSDKKAI